MVEEADPAEFAGLFIAGCGVPPCLTANDITIAFVQQMDAMRRTIAASSAGVDLLIAAGLVAGRTVTSPAIMSDGLHAAGADVLTDPVVVNENWITSRSPADAQVLADTFVERLNGAAGIVARHMPSYAQSGRTTNIGGTASRGA